MHNVDHMSAEVELKNILSSNMALRLLLSGQYHLTAWSLVFAVVYWFTGVVVANLYGSQASLDFSQSKKMYVLLSAIVICMASAAWYSQALLEVLIGVSKSFKIEMPTLLELVKRWMYYIRPKVLLVTSVVYIVVGDVILHLPTGLDEWLRPYLSAPWNWGVDWQYIYLQTLKATCGLMLACGIQTFFATLLLFRKIFKLEFRLFHYRYLAPLNTFSSGLTIASFVAVALYNIAIYPKVNLLGSVVGIIGGILMFIASQLAYQYVVAQAKKPYFHRLGMAYENAYKTIEQNHIDSQALQFAKEEIEALKVFEEKISRVPIWLIDTSDIARILLSLLAPIFSLLANSLLSRLP